MTLSLGSLRYLCSGLGFASQPRAGTISVRGPVPVCTLDLGGSRAHSLELSGPGPLGPLEIGQWGSVFIFQSLASEGELLVFFHS